MFAQKCWKSNEKIVFITEKHFQWKSLCENVENKRKKVQKPLCFIWKMFNQSQNDYMISNNSSENRPFLSGTARKVGPDALAVLPP